MYFRLCGNFTEIQTHVYSYMYPLGKVVGSNPELDM
jgi:hypothetical protein